MSKQPDCIVIGAGTAGAAAAYFLARRGASVLVVDRQKEGQSGARWVNTVESRVFDDLELDVDDDVIFARASKYVLASADNEARISISDPPVVDVDMRALVRWLHDQARGAGVEIRFNTTARIGAYRQGRREVVIGEETISAPVVIDASGLSMAALAPHLVPEFEITSAYQAVHELRSIQAARLWMSEHRIEDENTLSFVCVEGGYSIINVFVEPERGIVSLLTSTMHRAAYRSGRQVSDDFVKSMSWIGDRKFGGGGLIPLRAPSDSFVDDGLIRIGDAAGMAFPTHGSGVATGMRAAELAANTASACLQRGITDVNELWEFNRLYHRQMGVVNAAYQPIRYFTMALTTPEVKALIDSGLVTQASIYKVLEASMLDFEIPNPRLLVAQASVLLPIVPRFARAVELAVRFYRHYGNFPARSEDFQAWNRKTRQLYLSARRLAVSGGNDGSLPEELR